MERKWCEKKWVELLDQNIFEEKQMAKTYENLAKKFLCEKGFEWDTWKLLIDKKYIFWRFCKDKQNNLNYRSATLPVLHFDVKNNNSSSGELEAVHINSSGYGFSLSISKAPNIDLPHMAKEKEFDESEWTKYLVQNIRADSEEMKNLQTFLDLDILECGIEAQEIKNDIKKELKDIKKFENAIATNQNLLALAKQKTSLLEEKKNAEQEFELKNDCCESENSFDFEQLKNKCEDGMVDCFEVLK